MASDQLITAFFSQGENAKRKKQNINDDAEAEPSTKKKKRNSASVKTVLKWERELNISLSYKLDDNQNIAEITCKDCCEFAADRTSSFVTGCTSVKRESVKYHKLSTSHERAVAAKAAKLKSDNNEPTPIEASVSKMDEDAMTKMVKLFRTAYYLAINDRPFSDFNNILELQKLNGISLGETYSNDKACKQFISNIAGSMFDVLKTELKRSPFISIYCDGSTDNSQVEKELIMVRLLDDFYPTIKYLKLEEPANAKADGILSAIDKAFEQFDMPDYKQKLVGFCSDGASVMMGERQGVIKKLKNAGQVPWVLPVWCLAHRLELAMKDCFKGEYLETVVEVLTSIYHFYQGSAKRNKEASDIAEVMDEQFLKPERCDGTRWVDHKLRAVTKLLRNWKILVMHMMNYAEDPSNGGQYRAKAKGILKKMTEYKLVWYAHLMKDLLNEVAKISLIFQREDICVSSAVTKVQAAHESLRVMLDNDGDNVKQLNNEIEGTEFKGETVHNIIDPATLSRERRRIVQSVMDCITSRLENVHENPVFLACHVFDQKNWPDHNNQTALFQYGTGDIHALHDHFSVPLQHAGFNVDHALNEWNELKLYVSRNHHFQGIHPLAIWQRVSQEDAGRGDYKNILMLIHLTSLYPLSNAACERGFSVMKRVKNDWRCRLGNAALDELLRIKITGPKLEQFDPMPVVRRWWLSGQRAKRPITVPYGPRP